jgi:surface-anchored protein
MNCKLISASFVMLMTAATSQAANLWNDGHGDMRITYESGDFDLFWRIDNSTVNGAHVEDGDYALEDLIAVVPDAPLDRPPGPEWDFIGNAEGEPVWLFDQSQMEDRPWPGVSTESLSSDDFVGNLSYMLTGVTGPGHFSLIQVGPVGNPIIFFQTSDGVSSYDAIHVPVHTHAHYAWLFTAPGKYTLDITAAGNLTPSAGGGMVSDIGTVTVWVAVPEPSSAALLALAAPAVLVFRRSRNHRS